MSCVQKVYKVMIFQTLGIFIKNVVNKHEPFQGFKYLLVFRHFVYSTAQKCMLCSQRCCSSQSAQQVAALHHQCRHMHFKGTDELHVLCVRLCTVSSQRFLLHEHDFQNKLQQTDEQQHNKSNRHHLRPSPELTVSHAIVRQRKVRTRR